MSVILCLANSIKDTANSKEYIDLSEDLHRFIWKNKDYFSNKVDLLSELNPYGDRVFDEKEIGYISLACDSLIQCITSGKDEYLLKQNLRNENLDVNDLIEFARSLKELCIKTEKSNQKIIAFGD